MGTFETKTRAVPPGVTSALRKRSVREPPAPAVIQDLQPCHVRTCFLVMQTASRGTTIKTEPDAGRFLGVVLETVVPVRLVETYGQDGVAGEREALAAGCQTDHAVPGSVAPGAMDAHPRRDLMRLLEGPQMAAIRLREPFGRGSQRVREARRHGGEGEIGCFPERDLGGRHVDPQVGPQPFLDPVDEESADMVHVHVRQHHVGHRCQIDSARFQTFDQLAGSRQIQVRIQPEPGIDEDGLPAAPHQNGIQRPVECVRRQEHVVQPCRPNRRVGIVSEHGRRKGQDPIADDQHVDLADAHRVS